MAYSARPTSTDSLTKLVNQPAHGFTQIGTIVTYSLSAGMYVLSQADSLLHAQAPLMISIIIDADNFYVTQEGWVSGIQTVPETPFAVGTQYYLSASNPGHLTSTQPAAPGDVVSALFVADTTTSGYFMQISGILIGGGSVISQWYTVNADVNPMLPNSGYYVNSAGNINLTLPPNMPTGTMIGIASINTGTFTILQNNFPISPGNQTINFINLNTTPGAAGNIALTTTLGVNSGTLFITSLDNGTHFKVINSTGNFIVT